jgi:nicotinamide mononucleotide (NMN) deamidase PncC
MASGALDRCPADITAAIKGVAAPEPDEDGNPVGVVYVAVAAPSLSTYNRSRVSRILARASAGWFSSSGWRLRLL